MAELDRIEALMSTYMDTSEMSRVNASAYAQPQKVTAELFGLLKIAMEISVATDGAFDISYDSVGQLYDFRAGKHPDENQIAAQLENIDYHHVILDEAAQTVSFKTPGVRINLGGIAKGYAIALILGTPMGFLLGLSATFSKMFDPIIQVLRPVSPLAWMPLGVVLFANAGKSANELAALFTIAVCAMWPTVLNTAVGVRAIPQDYLNVARVLKLSRTQTLFRIMIPATLPYMFTGYRLSLGIAWLVIVAVEMLTGRIGIGNFLWNEYNNGLYTSIVLCIVTIGLVGFSLDRAMSLLERRFKSIL